MVALSALLSMRDIRKSFGGVPANDGVSLEVGEGEIHALLGENGAGKTTLMNILYGIYQADSGSIALRGEELRGHGPREAIRRGIGMVHQHFMLVNTLTVSENVTLGLRSPGHPFPRRRALDKAIAALSERFGLGVDPAAPMAALSVGERQRVEIIKLLYRDARLLILDEPTAVLTPAETAGLFGVLKRLKAEGHSVILITHRIPEVMEIADRITILRNGAAVAVLDRAEATPERLSTLMIGRPLRTRAPRPGAAPVAEPGLSVQGLSLDPDPRTGRGSLHEISFGIAAGEILGIAGVDGNGQKELAECVLGLRRSGRADIRIAGLSAARLGVRARKRAGLAYISDDRHHDGLMMGMDLAENFLLGRLDDRAFVRGGFVRRRACLAATSAAVRDYRIKTTGPAQEARLLSGGNQQKLILARELGASPKAIIAFQPTRGLDIGATEFVQDTLLARRAAGASILLISSDLDELLAVSDRIAVLHRGALSEALPNDGSLDLTGIGLLMGGHR